MHQQYIHLSNQFLGSAEISLLVTGGFSHAEHNPNLETHNHVFVPECRPVLFRDGDVTALYGGGNDCMQPAVRT